MTKTTRDKVLLLVLLLGILFLLVQRQSMQRPEAQPNPRPPAERSSAEPPGDAVGFTVTDSRPLPRAGKLPSEETIATAHQHLKGGGRTGSCGPYSMTGDITDDRLLASCSRIASSLDDAYQERFGVEPIGLPAAAIILFSERGSYRGFAQAAGMSSAGYAGFSMPSLGYTAVWADSDRPVEFSRTLAHELTHMVNRRALGGELPRWLSEGLADAIGDTATENGIGDLYGIRGVEGEAERLGLALQTGQAGTVLDLVAQQDSEFDAGGNSYDYEHSALLVRFLLTDPELTPRFRSFLTGLSRGEPSSLARLEQDLEVEWTELDQRFKIWLGAQID